MGGAQRLSRILDKRYAKTTTEIHNRREVSALTVEVHQDDGLRQSSGDDAGFERFT